VSDVNALRSLRWARNPPLCNHLNVSQGRWRQTI